MVPTWTSPTGLKAPVGGPRDTQEDPGLPGPGPSPGHTHAHPPPQRTCPRGGGGGARGRLPAPSVTSTAAASPLTREPGGARLPGRPPHTAAARHVLLATGRTRGRAGPCRPGASPPPGRAGGHGQAGSVRDARPPSGFAEGRVQASRPRPSRSPQGRGGRGGRHDPGARPQGPGQAELQPETLGESTPRSLSLSQRAAPGEPQGLGGGRPATRGARHALPPRSASSGAGQGRGGGGPKQC